MKNNILTFLLGIFVTISIAATVPNTGLLTVKPAVPKLIFAKSYSYDEHLQRDNDFKYYFKKGYVLKYYHTEGYNSLATLVMEKY